MASPLAAPLPWDLVATAYAAEVMPIFDRFARIALELGGADRGQHLVDVACGPGTLSVRAAELGATVAAIDFSPEMVANFRARIAADALTGIAVQVGDGQQLPYDDGTFDAGFSMFGLMFFPDRAAGFRELRRVVKPGGRVVVSSWHPLDQVPFMAAFFGKLGEIMRRNNPTAPAAPPRFPLIAAADYQDEMGAAGFSDIAVSTVEASIASAPPRDLWANVQRTNAPIVLMQHQLGAAWQPIADEIGDALEAQFGSGPQTITMRAWLGVAVA